jgi:hypothetical protein
MGVLVRVYLARSDDVLAELARTGVLVEGTLAGTTKPGLPEASFIAEVEAASEQEAVDKLRAILGAWGPVSLEPLGAWG